MKTVEVLIVVDVVGATSSGNLSDNLYMIDTNKYLGSYGEGTHELSTKCHDDQKIIWRVASISPDNDVNITEFTGQIITERICVPKKNDLGDEEYWEGIVETRGDKGNYQYACTLRIDGKLMSFDPFLDVI
ncbi:inclusion body family protein [Halosquirtibacter xylanolyticus]|uniref:alpha-pore-forming tripartite toxin MakABE regulator n=1 Tax=Halosquirtibacter xylanolyticus TaxID=3374599 RepID=UPI00374A0AD2|nr:inclusion body family protein [Prolixibacteraceae bacterium]